MITINYEQYIPRFPSLYLCMYNIHVHYIRSGITLIRYTIHHGCIYTPTLSDKIFSEAYTTKVFSFTPSRQYTDNPVHFNCFKAYSTLSSAVVLPLNFTRNLALVSTSAMPTQCTEANQRRSKYRYRPIKGAGLCRVAQLTRLLGRVRK